MTIMLMHNLGISEGRPMCNGTCLIITEWCNNVIEARMIAVENAGKEFHMNLQSDDKRWREAFIHKLATSWVQGIEQSKRPQEFSIEWAPSTVPTIILAILNIQVNQ